MSEVLFSCSVPLEVVPSQSLRFRVIGKFVQKYQPQKVMMFKKMVQKFVQEQLPAYWKPLEGMPIKVTFQYVYPFTKSMIKSKKFPVYKITRPDIDNCGKALQDALTGILWADDNIIAIRHSEKTYGAKAEIIIIVERI
jgi:Holliday junction resolvase RusA-like endonuclease